MVDTTGAEAALNDFETSAFAEDHVGDGDAAVCEDEFAVAVWGIYMGEMLVSEGLLLARGFGYYHRSRRH